MKCIAIFGKIFHLRFYPVYLYNSGCEFCRILLEMRDATETLYLYHKLVQSQYKYCIANHILKLNMKVNLSVTICAYGLLLSLTATILLKISSKKYPTSRSFVR